MKKGFVVSVVLYPLLVMFLVLVMGILAMGQNRRKILDNMKLEVSEESETDPEMSNSALYYKMKALEEAYAEMSSRLSEERFEEMSGELKKYADTKSQTAGTTATNNSKNYTDNSMNSMRTSLQSEINTAKSLAISTAKTQTKLEAFPIGSIFTSTTSTNPSSYIGGTWIAYGQGRTLIGVGTGTDSNSKNETFSAGSVGGEYTHRLTAAELPTHEHYYTLQNGGLEAGYGFYFGGRIANTGVAKALGEGSNVGNGPHNNIQPYIVVYFWKRTT